MAKMATLVALAAKETPGYFADYGGSFEVSEDTGRTFESKIHYLIFATGNDTELESIYYSGGG